MNLFLRSIMPTSVALVAVLSFAPVIPGGEYVFDDHVLIERNTDLQRADVWRASWSRDYYASSQAPGRSGYYRPMAVLVNALDVHAWGSGPRGGHLTNLILHVLASLALIPALRAIGVTLAAAWSVALFFAAHPVHAESVAFISGRVDVLAALFILCTMAAAAQRWRLNWLAVGLGAMLAFLSKEIAITLPVLLVLVWQANKAADRRRPAWPKQQMIAVVAAFVLVLVLRQHALGQLLPTTAGNERPAGAALLPLQTIVFFLGAIFAPLKRISMEPHPGSLSLLQAGIGSAAGVLLWTLAWRFVPAARGVLRRALLAGGVAMLPVLNLLPQETLLSERFLYLASGFLLLPIGVLLQAGWTYGSATRAAVVTFSVIVLAVLLGISGWRAEIWRTDVRLWRQAVQEEPQRAAFWDRLGLALTERRAFSEAEVALRRAVALDPGLSNAQNNLGVLLHSTRRYDEAVVVYREAIRLQPGSVGPHLNLGMSLAAIRDLEGAYVAYTTALGIKPDHFEANKLAGTTALALRRYDEARRYLEAAQRLAPGNPTVRQALEKVRRAERRRGEGDDG